MLHYGDCLEVLKTLADNSVDSLVTDPPYGIRFMGKAWDGADIVKQAQRDMRKEPVLKKDGKIRQPRVDASSEAGKYSRTHKDMKAFQDWTEQWAIEVLRVLKPGAHALVFCSPRSYHRMACGMENAGFEIRDQIQWLFGSGFPKSLDISKAIDKAAGAKREVIGKNGTRPVQTSGRINAEASSQGHFEREDNLITYPATDAAKLWDGFGTALKPANEPIVLVRKPISEKTVAANVLMWGVGGLNIDGCRIAHNEPCKMMKAQTNKESMTGGGKIGQAGRHHDVLELKPTGRFPANLVFSHSPYCTDDQCDLECAVKILDRQSGILKSGDLKKDQYKDGKKNKIYGKYNGFEMQSRKGDIGGASRFFYCAKVSSSERNAGCVDMTEKRRSDARPNSGDLTGKFPDHDNRITSGNHHPTVKPLKLMRYLCRLITPPNGIILDPFMGSGSTGIAAKQEGFEFIGIEREKEYFEIAKARVNSL